MRIRFGNQTAFSAPSLLAPFDFAVEHGFDAFELFPDTHRSSGGWSEQDFPATQRETVRQAARARDIRLSVHARLQANPVIPGGLPLLREDLQLARQVDASLLLVHLDLSRGLEPFLAGVLAVVDELGEAGIDLAIENTPQTGPAHVNALFERLDAEAVSSRCNVGLCFDLGHANLCAATHNDYLRFLDDLGPHVPVVHVHMHENFGDRDSHLTLFTGPSADNPAGVQGWLDRMQARGFSGSVIFEQWPKPPSLLLEARQRLMAMVQTAQRRSRADRGEDHAELPAREHGNEVVDAITQGDRRNPSWRQKLAWVLQYLTDTRPDTHTLAYLAIYLRFLGTGELRCEEGGGHYRPCHHARISARLQERLRDLRAPDTAFVIRRLLPWLPSAHESFTRAEPLTRIRDLAHRNDIPHALKQELKHTLQNKLHRNAGPEDLRTSTALLARFTREDSQLPSAFIDEFKRFHAELEEFFHARSLREQLLSLENHAPAEQKRLQRELLVLMDNARTPEQLQKELQLITQLRGLLRERAEAGDAVETQPEALTGIRLEEYAFTLLSRLNNLLDAQGEHVAWHLALSALETLLDGLALSDVDPDESRAVASELQAWKQGLDIDDRWQLLRLVASLERARRLTDAFAAEVQALFSDKVERLGCALGVEAASRKLLAEAEIRTHPVFQLARLTGTLLRQARERLHDAPWDVVVPGTAVGPLFRVKSLDKLAASETPCVVLVDEVMGDEQLPSGLTALLTTHEVPHLSHLAIRARQQRIVMACARQESAVVELRPMEGQRVVVDTGALSPSLVRPARNEKAAPRPPRHAVAWPRSGSHASHGTRTWLALEQATTPQAGAKADAARRLDALARMSRGSFEAPEGLVLPFVALEAALRTDSCEARRYRELRERLQHEPADALPGIAAELAAATEGLKVPQDAVDAIWDRFGSTTRLMVRSSANTEDLESYAAAGLHDTRANVQAANVEGAIRRVWASLWTPRAVAGRAQQGIPQHAARMAVLVQPMITADYAFVVHTVNPITLDARQVYVELVLGMGETLARGDEPGTPYRLVFDTQTEQVLLLAFESLSHGRWPDNDGGLERVRIDHARVRMSNDRELQRLIVRKIARVSKTIAAAMEAPQDIEGVLANGRVVIVQSRRQQGVPL